ncbi:MAG: hypothetical protein K2J76_01285 [Oscillospiraceae bacterium]|nr:hypothetical protein [Oscillospiraceae bacterium]
MSFLKKSTAFIAAAAMALSMSSCGKDTTWGAEIDGEQLRAGIMIYFQSSAVSEAMAFMPSTDATAAADGEATTTTESLSVLDITIEDKPAREWINDKAVQSMREYAAVEKKFDELGLTFENKEEDRLNIVVDQMWDYFGEYYEELGVSKQSYHDVGLNSEKRTAIFNYYYGEGGEKAVSEDAIAAYLTDSNVRRKYFAMPLKDGEGNLLKSEGKAELKAMAEGYIDRLNASSATFEEIEKEYNDYYAALVKAAAEAAEGEASDTAEQPETETETVAAEPSYGTVISKNSTYPSEKFVKAAFGEIETPAGDYILIEDDDNEVYYLVQVMNLFDDPDYLENNRDYVLHTLKDEEFDAEVKSWTEGQNVVVNQDSVDRYKLDKILE